jgi:hypothetical protein
MVQYLCKHEHARHITEKITYLCVTIRPSTSNDVKTASIGIVVVSATNQYSSFRIRDYFCSAIRINSWATLLNTNTKSN